MDIYTFITYCTLKGIEFDLSKLHSDKPYGLSLYSSQFFAPSHEKRAKTLEVALEEAVKRIEGEEPWRQY